MSTQSDVRDIITRGGRGNKGWKPTADDPPQSGGLKVWRMHADALGENWDDFVKKLEPDPGTKAGYRMRSAEDLEAEAAEQAHQAVIEQEIVPAADTRLSRPPEEDEDEGAGPIGLPAAVEHAERATAAAREAITGERAARAWLPESPPALPPVPRAASTGCKDCGVNPGFAHSTDCELAPGLSWIQAWRRGVR